MDSTPAEPQVQRSNVPPQGERSMAFALTKVPIELDTGDEEDLEAISKIYNQFWIECQDCYIFEVDEKCPLTSLTLHQ